MTYLVWTRRQTLASFLAGASVMTLGTHAALATSDAAVSFDQGVASGDPLNDRVIIWTRATPSTPSAKSIDVTWMVATDPELKTVIRSGDIVADADTDYTVKIDVDRLTPGTTYYYGFKSGDQSSIIGRTKTLPSGNVSSLKIAVLSCSNYQGAFFNTYRAMSEVEDLDLSLHLGDYIYEYGSEGFGAEMGERLGRLHMPTHEIVSLDDYRQRYAQYRTDPDLQALHAHAPMIAVWDDHETANNSWTDGAQNHAEDGSEGEWDERKKAFTRAYHEWLPLRSPSEDLSAIQRSFQIGSLASIVMLEGRLTGRNEQIDYAKDLPYVETPFDFSNPDAPIAITDEATLKTIDPSAVRTIKTPFDLSSGTPVPILDYQQIAALDPENLPAGIQYLPNKKKFLDEIVGADARQLLGTEQEAWLGEELAKSKKAGTTWQIVGSPIMMTRYKFPDITEMLPQERLNGLMSASRFVRGFFQIAKLGLPANLDGWDGYPAARERIYEMARNQSANLIVVAGDTHLFAANELKSTGDGKRVAVEFATTAVSATTLGKIFRLEDVDLGGAMVEANDEMRFANTNDHGGILLTLTPTEARADYIIVDTVESRDFKSSVVRSFVVSPNEDGRVGPLREV